MVESFGARLRRRREEQGIDLIAIAAQTKIKLSLLEGLERDDVSHWPPGIFRRAYIRAYGHAIGLDPDLVVREFLEAYPEPAEVVTTEAIASLVDGGRTNGGPPTRLRNILGSAIGSLSRLRRSPAVENLVVAEGGWVDLSTPAQPELPIAVDPSPEPDPASPDPDFLEVAHLCTAFGRVETGDEVQPLLQEAARILDATGLIIWVWDESAEGLRPALAHGYSDKVLAQLPAVGRDADNATAAAFRSAQACAIKGSDHASGALVVPLMMPEGCAGVLAIELQHGREQTPSVRAVATIFAAAFAQLAGRSRPAEVRPQADMTVPQAGELHDDTPAYKAATLTR